MNQHLETLLIRVGQAIFLAMLVGGVVLLLFGWIALLPR